MGSNITTTTNQDLNAAFDLPDIQQDIPFIQSLNQPQVAWRWYQNGYDAEPNDSAFALPHTNYVSHHNGAQYFGYLANNPAERGNYRGENDFFTDMANNALPPAGSVFLYPRQLLQSQISYRSTCRRIQESELSSGRV